MPLFYVVFMLAFYAWHYQAHNRLAYIPFNTACRQYHLQHHWHEFPPQAFYGTAEAAAHYGDTAATMSSWRSALPLASSPQHEVSSWLLALNHG
jgi:hypothetical protein